MERKLIGLWILCIQFATVAGLETKCDAPAVFKDQAANVTCHFENDVSQTGNDVFVHITNRTDHYYDVLSCSWIGGLHEYECTTKPGYSVVGSITNTLVLEIESATEEFVGVYVCQVLPSDPKDLTPCNFTLKVADTSLVAGKEKNDSAENAALIAGCVVIVFAVAAGVIAAIYCKCFKNRRQTREQADAPPTKTALLTNHEGASAPPASSPDSTEMATGEMQALIEGTASNSATNNDTVTNKDSATNNDTVTNKVNASSEIRDEKDGRCIASSSERSDGERYYTPASRMEGPGPSHRGIDVDNTSGPIVPSQHTKSSFALDSTQGPRQIRVVMIGKIGAGKSSLGNSILGPRHFGVGHDLSSETIHCSFNCGSRNNFDFQVVDTPGLCNTHRPEEDVYREVGKSVALAAPGPHIILMVLRCDRRFTKEYGAYVTLKKLFGDQICKHMIIIFNALDAFAGYDDDEADLEELRAALQALLAQETASKELRQIISEAKGGYFGMNNKAPTDVKEKQMTDLVGKMVTLMRQNGNACYSSDPVEINRRIDEMVQQRM